MTSEKIAQLLKTLDIPFRYKVFGETPTPPYIVYYADKESRYGSDDMNLLAEREIIIELYTDKKDLEIESKIDKLFENYSFVKYENYIDSERMFETAYHVTFIDKI